MWLLCSAKHNRGLNLQYGARWQADILAHGDVAPSTVSLVLNG